MIFNKYHGAGNDFILIDNRKNIFKAGTTAIAKLCDRRFGIGADGLILLNKSAVSDFEMIYFNADGRIGSMCGNGARCIVLFAHDIGMIKSKTTFTAYDGLHTAEIISINKKNNSAIVKLQMQDVNKIERTGSDFFIDTGSPHYIRFVKNVTAVNVLKEGKKIRYSSRYKQKGVNVNFVSAKHNKLFIRSYERGVENETLACGTGITASALAADASGIIKGKNKIEVNALGGKLSVYFTKSETGYSTIFLEGEAAKVFEGEILF